MRKKNSRENSAKSPGLIIRLIFFLFSKPNHISALYAGSHMAFSDLFFSSLITFLFLDFNRSDRKGQLEPGKIHKSHLCIPNFHIHVSVSDLHIPRIGPHIFLQQNRQTDPGNRYCTSHGNWLWPHNFFSGNICFKFSVLCLYARYIFERLYTYKLRLNWKMYNFEKCYKPA
jgi:hypothetical protein